MFFRRISEPSSYLRKRQKLNAGRCSLNAICESHTYSAVLIHKDPSNSYTNGGIITDLENGICSFINDFKGLEIKILIPARGNSRWPLVIHFDRRFRSTERQLSPNANSVVSKIRPDDT